MKNNTLTPELLDTMDANPTIVTHITHDELQQLLHGYRWAPLLVEGQEPALMRDRSDTVVWATDDLSVSEIDRST